MKRLKQLPEFVRFVMVGIFATALHYGLYFVLQRVINVNIAYTLGYALSFIANFYLTAYFTFGRKPSWRKAFGFGGAHLCSYLLHMGLLNLSLWMGISKPLAPIPGFRHRHSGQLLTRTFRFQKKRVIICFSPDFLRILQKDLFYDGKLSHTRRCRTLLQRRGSAA